SILLQIQGAGGHGTRQEIRRFLYYGLERCQSRSARRWQRRNAELFHEINGHGPPAGNAFLHAKIESDKPCTASPSSRGIDNRPARETKYVPGTGTNQGTNQASD